MNEMGRCVLELSENRSDKFPADGRKAAPLVSLMTDYAHLVRSRAMSFICSDVELDDLMQEGFIGLLNASESFNGELSAFTTYARKCIDSAIIDFLRRTHKLSRIPESLIVDIDDVSMADVSPEPDYLVSVKDEFSSVIKRAENELSDFEFVVFSGILKGLGYEEIAKLNGVGVKAVRNAVGRFRAKLK